MRHALEKRVHMKSRRFAKQLAAATGLLIVSVLPDQTSGQSRPPAPAQTPLKTMPSARPQRAPDPMEDLAGLTLSEEQKAKIQQIRQDTKSRLDAVVKDNKLDPDQKGAMFTGFRRLERNQIFEVLTPEQQSEVRKKVQARRKAEKQQSPPPQPFPQPPSGR